MYILLEIGCCFFRTKYKAPLDSQNELLGSLDFSPHAEQYVATVLLKFTQLLSKTNSVSFLKVERQRRLERIKQKQSQLQELILQVFLEQLFALPNHFIFIYQLSHVLRGAGFPLKHLLNPT